MENNLYSEKIIHNPQKYNNWILRNAFNILIFPITVLSIILGIYGEVIDQRLNNADSKKIDYYKAFTYINFFKHEINTDTLVNNVELLFNTKIKYNHLFILDRTYSTYNPELNTKTFQFQKDLKVLLTDDFKDSFLNQSDKFTTKRLIILSIYQALIRQSNTSNFCVAFYDGDNTGLKFLDFEDQNETPVWFNCSNNDTKKLLINKLNNYQIYKKLNSQSTDFDEIFKTIKDVDTTNMIVTIVSDFDHELKSIEETTIENLQKGKNKIVQFNIVYLPPENSLSKQRSLHLIKLLSSKFNNDILKHIIIDLNDFYNENYNQEIFNSFNIKRNQCFNKIESSENIYFYYPKKDFEGSNIVKSKILVKNSESLNQLYWKISTNNNERYPFNGTFIYPNIDQTSNFNLNGIWHNFPQSNDTLEVNFRLNSIENDQPDFNIYNGNSGVTQTHKTIFIKLLPSSVATVGLYSLYLIFILYFLIIISHLIRTYDFFRHSLKPSIKHIIFEFGSAFISLTLLVGIISNSIPNWLFVVCFLIIVSHIFLMVLYLLFFRKKRIA